MYTLDTQTLAQALEQLPPYAPDVLLGLYRRACAQQRRQPPLLAPLDPADVAAAIAEADAIIERTRSLAQALATLQPIPAARPCPEFGL